MSIKKIIIGIVGAFIAVSAIVLVLLNFNVLSPQDNTEQILGNSTSPGERGGNWYVYDQFTGFKTKYDPSKIDDGANANGQNTTINDGDRISVRQQGYDLFPTGGAYSSTTASAITSMHTFRRRDGENILMRSWGTVLEYFEEGNDLWEVVSSTYSVGQKFGYADMNINTDLTPYVYFGNGIEDFSRWTGEHVLISTVVAIGDNNVKVDSTAGFPATGSITFCSSTHAYSSLTSSQFNLTGTATVACAVDRSVIEAVTLYAGNPKGNIYMSADNRLWIAGVATTTQAVFFSKYGDATEFTTTTLINDNTDSASGIFNLGEGGGGVTAMIQDESAIYLFKRSIIRKATLSDTLYTLGTLKPFDGKSQTVGSVGNASTFTSGNEVFFITPDNQILRLARVEGVDYPQLNPISDVIKNTINGAVFTSSTGIVFRNKAYFAAKSDSSVSYNDTVFVYNLQTQTWDSPIVGWAVGDWAVYDDGGGEDLYWGSAYTPDVFQVTDDYTDFEYTMASNWRSKQFSFGSPQAQKIIDNVFVEGYISSNTELTISLLLDEDGFTQTYSTEITGVETDYIYSSVEYNIFGFHPFGYERFGTNSDLSGKKKFRVYLNKNFTPKPFYNAQIEFASDQQSAQWEVTSFGFNVRPFSQQVKPSLMREFN